MEAVEPGGYREVYGGDMENGEPDGDGDVVAGRSISV